MLSLVKAFNFTEGAGHAEVCLTFSLQFISSFTIHLSTVVSPNITILHRGMLCDVYSQWNPSTVDALGTAEMFWLGRELYKTCVLIQGVMILGGVQLKGFHSIILCHRFVLQHTATPDIDYAAIPLTLSPGIEDSRNRSLCFKFAIFDDEILEPDECIAISIESAPDTVRIAENGTTTTLCIIDDGK